MAIFAKVGLIIAYQESINHSIMLNNTAVDYAWTPDTYCSNAWQSNLMIGGSDGNSAMTIDPHWPCVLE